MIKDGMPRSYLRGGTKRAQEESETGAATEEDVTTTSVSASQFHLLQQPGPVIIQPTAATSATATANAAPQEEEEQSVAPAETAAEPFDHEEAGAKDYGGGEVATPESTDQTAPAAVATAGTTAALASETEAEDDHGETDGYRVPNDNQKLMPDEPDDGASAGAGLPPHFIVNEAPSTDSSNGLPNGSGVPSLPASGSEVGSTTHEMSVPGYDPKAASTATVSEGIPVDPISIGMGAGTVSGSSFLPPDTISSSSSSLPSGTTFDAGLGVQTESATASSGTTPSSTVAGTQGEEPTTQDDANPKNSVADQQMKIEAAAQPSVTTESTTTPAIAAFSGNTSNSTAHKSSTDEAIANESEKEIQERQQDPSATVAVNNEDVTQATLEAPPQLAESVESTTAGNLEESAKVKENDTIDGSVGSNAQENQPSEGSEGGAVDSASKDENVFTKNSKDSDDPIGGDDNEDAIVKHQDDDSKDIIDDTDIIRDEDEVATEGNMDGGLTESEDKSDVYPPDGNGDNQDSKSDSAVTELGHNQRIPPDGDKPANLNGQMESENKNENENETQRFPPNDAEAIPMSTNEPNSGPSTSKKPDLPTTYVPYQQQQQQQHPQSSLPKQTRQCGSLSCQLGRHLLLTISIAAFVPVLVLILWFRRKRARDFDSRGEYRAVAAQYSNMRFDNAFTDDFSSDDDASYDDDDDDDENGHAPVEGSWSKSGARVIEMGNLKDERNGGLSLEEMNG